MSAKIRKVKALKGVARVVASKRGLKPDDLVIVDYNSGYIEKIEGDPVSYLLKRLGELECPKCDGKLYKGRYTFWCNKCGQRFIPDELLNLKSDEE